MKGRASIIRLCFTVIFLFIATYTFSACTPTPPHCASSEVFCVGLVIGTGVVDDNSINQSSWEALQQSYTEGFVNWIYYIETNDARDYDENIAVFAEAGYDVVVTSGSYLAEASLAGAQTYPQVMFIAVDQPAGTFTSQGKTSPPNLVGLIFPEDHAGFLAGALAAMMTQTDKIGAICSTDEIASIWHYCEGYRAGAHV